MKHITHNKIQKGFTLIEMLVVIAVVTTISAISVANFRNGEKQKRVVLASEIIVNALRNAQNFSLTSRQIQNAGCYSNTPIAYSIVFPNVPATSILLYGYDKCGNERNLIETYNVPVNTSITAYSVDSI